MLTKVKALPVPETTAMRALRLVCRGSFWLALFTFACSLGTIVQLDGVTPIFVWISATGLIIAVGLIAGIVYEKKAVNRVSPHVGG
jgi:hypothetical protein